MKSFQNIWNLITSSFLHNSKLKTKIYNNFDYAHSNIKV